MGIEYTDQLPTYEDRIYRVKIVGRSDNVRDYASNIRKREEMVKKYSWAIPSEEALQTIAKFSPIVEIGAGTGYWAYELRKRGAEIHAYDAYPPDGTDFTEDEIRQEYDLDKEDRENRVRKNWYHRGYPSWTDVQEGTPDVLKTYDATWNLFLCWPPMSDMAMYALGYHRGTYICYVGESDGGCNADRKFFRLLYRFYDEVESVSIPQWPGLHDYLTVYKRKGR